MRAQEGQNEKVSDGVGDGEGSTGPVRRAEHVGVPADGHPVLHPRGEDMKIESNGPSVNSFG